MSKQSDILSFPRTTPVNHYLTDCLLTACKPHNNWIDWTAALKAPFKMSVETCPQFHFYTTAHVDGLPKAGIWYRENESERSSFGGIKTEWYRHDFRKCGFMFFVMKSACIAVEQAISMLRNSGFLYWNLRVHALHSLVYFEHHYNVYLKYFGKPTCHL